MRIDSSGYCVGYDLGGRIRYDVEWDGECYPQPHREHERHNGNSWWGPRQPLGMSGLINILLMITSHLSHIHYYHYHSIQVYCSISTTHLIHTSDLISLFVEVLKDGWWYYSTSPVFWDAAQCITVMLNCRKISQLLQMWLVSLIEYFTEICMSWHTYIYTYTPSALRYTECDYYVIRLWW